jgi:hypothetical protein
MSVLAAAALTVGPARRAIGHRPDPSSSRSSRGIPTLPGERRSRQLADRVDTTTILTLTAIKLSDATDGRTGGAGAVELECPNVALDTCSGAMSYTETVF